MATLGYYPVNKEVKAYIIIDPVKFKLLKSVCCSWNSDRIFL